MAAAGSSSDPKLAELTAMIRGIQERVRAEHPQGEAHGVRLIDLTPVIRARDAAEGKVAAIGTVNPRPPGLVNDIAQSLKRFVSRALNWHVREQIEFNRAALRCIEALTEALNDANRSVAELAGLLEPARANAVEARDLSSHWIAWRSEWERKLSANEMQFLRSVADLQGAFQHRASLMESNFREIASAQHKDFTAAVERSGDDIQKRFWVNFEKIQIEFQQLIHHELRLIRQRAQIATAGTPSPAAPPAPRDETPDIDWLLFAQKFRGSEEAVRTSFERYVPRFRGCERVLDIGCGRGEFLSLMKDAGIAAAGIDLNAESVAQCRAKGLEASRTDLFEYLEAQPPDSIGGIFCSQVIEHLAPASLARLMSLCASRLKHSAPIVFETPNPECLAVFATHFYLDPTHRKPIPPALLCFYLEEAGLGQIEVTRLAPAVETMPSLAQLPVEFRHAFFGALDYYVFARRVR